MAFFLGKMLFHKEFKILLMNDLRKKLFSELAIENRERRFLQIIPWAKVINF